MGLLSRLHGVPLPRKIMKCPQPKKNAHAKPLTLTEAELTQNADIIQRGVNYYDP